MSLSSPTLKISVSVLHSTNFQVNFLMLCKPQKTGDIADIALTYLLDVQFQEEFVIY